MREDEQVARKSKMREYGQEARTGKRTRLLPRAGEGEGEGEKKVGTEKERKRRGGRSLSQIPLTFSVPNPF